MTRSVVRAESAGALLGVSSSRRARGGRVRGGGGGDEDGRAGSAGRANGHRPMTRSSSQRRVSRATAAASSGAGTRPRAEGSASRAARARERARSPGARGAGRGGVRWTPCGLRARRGPGGRADASKFIGRGDARPRDVCAPLPGAPRLGRGVGPQRWLLLGGAHQGHRVPRRGVRARGGESRRAPASSLPGQIDRRAASPPPSPTRPATPSAFAPAGQLPSRRRPRRGVRTRLSLDPPSVVVGAATSSRPPRSCTSPPAVPLRAPASFYAKDVNLDAVASTRDARRRRLSRDDDDDPRRPPPAASEHCLRCDLLGPCARPRRPGRPAVVQSASSPRARRLERVHRRGVGGGPTEAGHRPFVTGRGRYVIPGGDVPAPPVSRTARGREAILEAGARGERGRREAPTERLCVLRA